jgi:voltage-gated potassium channel
MLFTIIILLITSAGLMYEAEHAAQPEAFASIPDAMWWGIVTWPPWGMAISIRSPPGGG